MPHLLVPVEVEKPRSPAAPFGLWNGGLIAMALAVVAVHDEYQERLIPTLPTALWD